MLNGITATIDASLMARSFHRLDTARQQRGVCAFGRYALNGTSGLSSTIPVVRGGESLYRSKTWKRSARLASRNAQRRSCGESGTVHHVPDYFPDRLAV